jgi:hypothetical protein
MTADQREQGLLQSLDSLSRLPRAKRKPIDPEDIERAARRGARKARRFLAENPTQESIQASWDMYSWELHSVDDSPVDFAYYAAYLKTLQRRVTRSPTAKKTGTRPILTVMDDYGTGSVLWLNWVGNGNIGAGGRCCDADYRCGVHPLSDELYEAFKEWISVFADARWTEGALINPNDPFSDYLVKPAIILNWPDFHVRGLELGRQLKREVGAAFRVVYEKSWADPARQVGQRYEVLDDGSVVALPARAIGRYSIGT